MLRNRGYAVAKADLEMTREEFIEKFGERPARESLGLAVRHKEREDEQLYVFFCEEAKRPKVGIAPIRLVAERLKERNASRAIIVVETGLTPLALQTLKEMDEVFSLQMEYFKEAELLIDITEHELVPLHEVMTEEEKQVLLKRYKLSESQLPRMQKTDPITRYYGLRKGQIVRIIRPSETAGRYVTYRIVCDV
jgi:DNA-directed RNA polymerase I, II, and III subunit RPABC1